MAQHIDSFRQAIEQHHAGQLRAAEESYRRILAREPGHRDAHHLLGVLLHARGEHGAAVEHFASAIRAPIAAADQPRAALLYRDYAGALCATGRLDEAEMAYREAIRCDPNLVEVHVDLASLLQSQRRHDEAVRWLETAINVRPDIAELHFNLGNSRLAASQREEAAACYRRAIELNPALAAAHYRLGLVLADEGRHAEAADCQRRAVSLDSTLADAYLALGAALYGLGNLADAANHYRRALELRPDDVAAMHGLGVTVLGQRAFSEAELWFRRLVERLPNQAEAHGWLGKSLHFQHRFDEAIECHHRALSLGISPADGHFWIAQSHLLRGDLEGARAEVEQVLRCAPNDVTTRVFRATLMLAQGDLPDGWREFEHRTRLPEAAARPVRAPLWDGSRLCGQTLLVESERGLGDALQFARYLPLIADRCDRVLFEARRPLVALLRESGFDNVIAEGDPLPPVDARIPLLSLPWIYQTTLESIPATVPYLRASAALVERWRERTAPLDGFKVGIHWQGNPTFVGDHHRSIPLEYFKALADVAGVTLISLQKDPDPRQLAALGGRVVVFEDLDRQGDAFMDTAALIESLDLVVASDSAVIHLAGALAAPAWLALSAAADWRWLVDRSDCPWYPSIRVFRQAKLGDWADVFSRLAFELSKVVDPSCTSAIPRS
jgi:tetratricopeptide (TPR) repeat protein